MQGRAPACLPFDILRDHIGTTGGNTSVLKWLLKKARTRAEFLKYTVALEDVAVYKGQVRDLYHRDHPNDSDVRQNLVIIFALWHIAKIVFIKVWEYHMHSIIGPAFKACFPQRSTTVVSFASLQQQAQFMTDMALAYEAERPAFLQLYRDHPTWSIVKHHYQFFEFFLPVVSPPTPPCELCMYLCFEGWEKMEGPIEDH